MRQVIADIALAGASTLVPNGPKTDSDQMKY